jgi:hypothetical protein
MIREVFVALIGLLYSAPLLAVLSSLTWGVLSIILSPCHMVSIPLIIGYVERQSGTGSRGPFVLSTIFAAGMIVAIALTATITGLLGRIIGDIGTVGYIVLSLAVMYAGLSILGWAPLPLTGSIAGRHAGRLSQRTSWDLAISLPSITFRVLPRKPGKTYRNPVIYAQELQDEMVRDNLSRRQLAQWLGVSSDRITQWLCLLKLPEEQIKEIESLGDNWDRQVVTERQLRRLRRNS